MHRLIHVLEAEDETAASVLLAKAGGEAEVGREIANRLYIICERKKRAAGVLSYGQSRPVFTAFDAAIALALR